MLKEMVTAFIAAIAIAAIIAATVVYVPYGDAIVFALVFIGGPIFLLAFAAYHDVRHK